MDVRRAYTMAQWPSHAEPASLAQWETCMCAKSCGQFYDKPFGSAASLTYAVHNISCEVQFQADL